MRLDSEFIAAALQPVARAPQFFVAYSGGLDSHVLLHLCSQLSELRGKLTAVHVHHGIQQQADSWVKHCADTATGLGVAFACLRVDAKPKPGLSPEETARNARYQAFAEILGPDQVILSAQHRDDQMETLLLQLFRGTGLAGLAAMPKLSVCGSGMLLRPLLEIPRSALQTYADEHRLVWVDDPSNAECAYDRNFLRNTIVPLLKQRWPGIGKTVARTARHCANAQSLLDEFADHLFAAAFDAGDRSISVTKLQLHDRYRQQLLLRRWFKHLGARMPSETGIERIVTELLSPPDGRYRQTPLSGDSSVRRYRDKLHLVISRQAIDLSAAFDWPCGEDRLALPNNGCLQLYYCSSPGIDVSLWKRSSIKVRYRRGGECLRPSEQSATLSLKDFFQKQGIPPWERERIPLLFIDGAIAAVGDRWLNTGLSNKAGAPNIHLRWSRLVNDTLIM